jgi:exosortase family protein XrtF
MLKEYKHAIIFLIKYLAIYLVLNTAYSFYVNSYLPGPDPITRIVTRQVAGLLAVFSPEVSMRVNEESKNVPLNKGEQTIVEVYEGCNGVNVMVVFVAFIIAFKGPWKISLKFILAGLVAIHIVNLLRVIGLYEVALHFPDKLYFFHKYFFTGVIYLMVFIIWYFWVNKIKWLQKKSSQESQ